MLLAAPWELLGAWRLGGLEVWRLGGSEDWRLRGFQAWKLAGFASWVLLGASCVALGVLLRPFGSLVGSSWALWVAFGGLLGTSWVLWGCARARGSARGWRSPSATPPRRCCEVATTSSPAPGSTVYMSHVFKLTSATGDRVNSPSALPHNRLNSPSARTRNALVPAARSPLARRVELRDGIRWERDASNAH